VTGLSRQPLCVRASVKNVARISFTGAWSMIAS
jgi:hypothetical protein